MPVSCPTARSNVKFDVIVSDLPAFKRAGKLLAAAKRVPEEKKDRPVRGAGGPVHGDPGHVGRGGRLDEITTLVAPVRKDLEKDMDAVRKAVGGDDPGPVRQGRASDRAEIRHTKAQPWFTDATSCAKINATYLHMKAMRESDKPMPSSALDRATKDQQKKFSQGCRARVAQVRRGVDREDGGPGREGRVMRRQTI